MKKLINDPKNVVEEMIDGYVKAHPEYVKQMEENERSLITAQALAKGKVVVLIVSGSCHEPAFMGYVDKSIVAACTFGNIYASPLPAPIQEATKAIYHGAGV